MARFRAVIRGQRGEASRLGSKLSGISASVNGWNAGVKVNARVSTTNAQGREVSDYDVFEIYVTGGSNGGFSDLHVGTVRGTVFTPAPYLGK